MDKIKNILLTSGLILGGAILRILLKDIPNIEPVTLMAILGGTLISRRLLALIVPLSAIALSDIAIGNTSILASTWSAWLIIGIATVVLYGKHHKKLYPVYATLTAAGSSIFFYLWTNAGVWIQTTMYPKNIGGLLQSYIMGLPFLRVQLFSNIIFASVASLTLVAVVAILKAQKQTTVTVEKHAIKSDL